ncbi:hypothetical protein MTO96_016257 [Rhipicephalus appendiculatus]
MLLDEHIRASETLLQKLDDSIIVDFGRLYTGHRRHCPPRKRGLQIQKLLSVGKASLSCMACWYCSQKGCHSVAAPLNRCSSSFGNFTFEPLALRFPLRGAVTPPLL